MWNKRSAGVTLIELVVAIVIVGVALAGMVAAFTRTDRASVDPVLTQQMAIIAEGMMEEILLKEYAKTAQPAQRIAYTSVWHYDGYHSTGVTDVEGNPVPGLEKYKVAISVTPPPTALPDVPTGDTCRIVVGVTHPNVERPISLVGWRTAPPADPAGATP